MIKVRFAPSPTGIPHIGNTRTALFNYLYAKHNRGEFIVRIEDTDRKRVVKEAEQAIIDILDWLGLEWDGEIVHQSERLDLYKKYVQELLDKKVAHEREGAVWVRLPENKVYEWIDGVAGKKISFNGKDVDEFVILKSDGFPTYHLANVVDDHLMGITDVIRGEEWISSTPKHLYLYACFGWKPPVFAHLPVILGTDKSKLSKRHGAKSILDYRDEGYVKEALLNYMALLGWNPGGDNEQMSLAQMCKSFTLEKVNTANPIFDIKKLQWLNGVWIRTLKNDVLEKKLLEYYLKNKEMLTVLSNKTTKGLILDLAKTRMRTLADFEKLVSEKQLKRKYTKEERGIAEQLLVQLESDLSDEWTEESLIDSLRKFNKEKNISFKTIYFILTGKEQGLPLGELLRIYHKDFFIKNLKGE